MAYCDTCKFHDKRYDEFRQNYDDVIIENEDQKINHYCPMYNDHIPYDIFYEGEKCQFYDKRNTDQLNK